MKSKNKGLVYAIRKYGYLFWGSKHPLVYKNDHKPLGCWGSWSLTPKLARWLDDLSSVEWRFEYVPGEQNGMADALSRPPGENETESSPYTQSTMNENIRARRKTEKKYSVTYCHYGRMDRKATVIYSNVKGLKK